MQRPPLQPFNILLILLVVCGCYRGGLATLDNEGGIKYCHGRHVLLLFCNAIKRLNAHWSLNDCLYAGLRKQEVASTCASRSAFQVSARHECIYQYRDGF